MSTCPRPVNAETRDVIVTGSAIDSPAGVSTSTVMGEVPFDLARTGMTNEVSSFGRSVTLTSPTSVASGSPGGGVDSGNDSFGDEKRRTTSSGSSDVLPTWTSMSPERPVRVNLNGRGRHHGVA